MNPLKWTAVLFLFLLELRAPGVRNSFLFRSCITNFKTVSAQYIINASIHQLLTHQRNVIYCHLHVNTSPQSRDKHEKDFWVLGGWVMTPIQINLTRGWQWWQRDSFFSRHASKYISTVLLCALRCSLCSFCCILISKSEISFALRAGMKCCFVPWALLRLKFLRYFGVLLIVFSRSLFFPSV
jgi:hypothetical protein